MLRAIFAAAKKQKIFFLWKKKKLLNLFLPHNNKYYITLRLLSLSPPLIHNLLVVECDNCDNYRVVTR